jgi:hypothetical protein
VTLWQITSKSAGIKHAFDQQRPPYYVFTSYNKHTSSTDLSTSFAATQELLSSLWIPKVHYSIHQSSPHHPILILSIHPRLRLPTGLFPCGFHANNLYAFLFSPHSCYMSCPSHPPWLDLSNYTWRRVSYEVLHYASFSNLLSLHPSSV